MPSLMIRDDGVYGDQCWKVPALRVLRPLFDHICVTSMLTTARESLENTGLVDDFLKLPEGFYDWLDADKMELG